MVREPRVSVAPGKLCLTPGLRRYAVPIKHLEVLDQCDLWMKLFSAPPEAGQNWGPIVFNTQEES